MKKNIIIFICGVIFAFTIGYLYVNQKLPVISQGKYLVSKVIMKLKDRRFNRTPKAKNELLFCDFEKKEDFDKWQLITADIGPSKEHVKQGALSAKVTFKTGKQVAAIKLADYFEKKQAIKDWSSYEGIAFDIFNPQETRERIIFQVKDQKGRKIKNEYFLEPLSAETIEVEIARMRKDLDIYNIGDFTFFLWEPSQQKVFYLDNIRLVPYGEKDKKNILASGLIETLDTAYATGNYFDFAKNKVKWVKANEAGGTFIEVPLFLANETNLNYPALPFQAGIPFPREELKDISNIQVADSQNNKVDFQGRVLCRWQDGSIKWLLLGLSQSVLAGQNNPLKLRYSQDIKEVKPEGKLKVEDTKGAITVITGPLKFSVSKKNFRLFDKIWLDGNKDGVFQDNELISQNNDLSLQFRSKAYSSSRDKDSEVKIEEEGPLKVTLKAEGWFVNEKGNKFCKYVVRIQAFRDAGYVRIFHTLIYTGYPENQYHYLYKGKHLPKNETIEDISISLPLSIPVEKVFTFAADKNVIQGKWLEDTELFQDSYQSFGVLKAQNKIHSGEKLEGWLDISNQNKGVSVGIKNFWQQFPKGFYLDKAKDTLAISLWPKRAGELDLKTTADAYGPDAVARGSAFGLAKTHEVMLYFHIGDYQASEAKNIITGFLQPLLIRIDPAWVGDTVALGKLHPYDRRLLSAEDTIEKLFDWGQKQKEDFHWYGMVDFGDTMSWYRRDAYDESYDEWGWHPRGHWGWFNCEGIGTHTGALIQYLRTGKSKYLSFGEDLARHIMDIDTCHYNTVANDRRLKGLIFDDYSQIGSMHRHNANHWGGRNEETTHTNLTGILLYYYITGDERTLDVAKEIGEFFLKERITYFKHPDVAPQRGIGNMLWGYVLMYEATQDERYKKAADKWADILYKGQHNNGSWTENYNPVEKRWDGDPSNGFMIAYTLPALIEYHQLTQNKAIKESIIKVTQYLMKTEEYGHPFDALAYSFWLSGDRKFYQEGIRRLDHLIAHQNQGEDRVMNGMIYGKAYYARMAEFVYRTPFILEVAASPMVTRPGLDKEQRNE